VGVPGWRVVRDAQRDIRGGPAAFAVLELPSLAPLAEGGFHACRKRMRGMHDGFPRGFDPPQ
jgi:hypothetical protein